jgi:hypothetical protein
MGQRDREGFAVVALIAWLTNQPCPRTVEYRYRSLDGAEGRLDRGQGHVVWRKLTLL